MYSVDDKIRFISSVFGTCKVSPNGLNVAITCPICKHKDKKKLSIRLSDDANHCWVCGFAGRSLLPLLFKYGSRDALEEYKQKFLQGKAFFDATPQEKPEEKPELPKDFKLLALLQSSIDPDIKLALNYLKRRGLTERDLWYFKFGISFEASFRRRIVFPSFNRLGQLNFLTARAVDKDVRLKYLNSRNRKTDIIFNEINIDWTKPITLVEGPFDLTKCNDNATCLMGSELTEDAALFNAILFHKTPVLLALDDDMRAKAQKVARKLVEYDVDVRLVDLGKHHDPGEMTKDEFSQALSTAKPWDWFGHMMFKINIGTSCSFKI